MFKLLILHPFKEIRPLLAKSKVIFKSGSNLLYNIALSKELSDNEKE